MNDLTRPEQSNRCAGASPVGPRTSQLSQLLQTVRRRLWMVDGLRGICWGLIAGLATLLMGMWFDLVWELSASVRAGTWVCAGVALLTLLLVVLLRTWHAIDSKRLAKRIDAASQGGGELVNGFEFAAGTVPVTNSPSDSLTRGLAELAVARAQQIAQRVRPSAVISPRPTIIAARWLTASLAVLILLTVVFPTLAYTQWQRFAHPWSDVPPYSLYQITVQPGDTEVVYGKGLEVRVSVAGGLARDVHLQVTSGDRVESVPMFPESSGTWRAQLSRITEDATYQAHVDRARSPIYRIDVITTPSIEDVRAVVTPPAYANLPATSVPIPKDGLVGLAGTRIQMTARSNRPLSSGEIRLTSKDQSELFQLHPVADEDSVITGEFTVSKSGKLELQVIDSAQQPSSDPFVTSVTLLTDQRPLVRILEPKTNSFATPTSMLPVVIDAEDDYGLSRVELHRSLNDSRPTPIAFSLSVPSPRRFRDQMHLPLARYDLEPGDEIKLFARVSDTDPATPKGAESTVVTIQIISQAEFERMVRIRQGLEVLTSKYQQAQRRLEKLAKEIATLQKELDQEDPDSAVTDSLREKLERLSKELHDEADAIAQAAEKELPYDLDKNLKDKMTQLAEELHKRGDELQQLTKDTQDKSDMNLAAVQRQLAKLANELGEEKEQFAQEASEPLELLAKVYPLMEDQARFTALTLWQTDLAERMQSFKEIERSEDPAEKARLRDLQDEQSRIRQELVQLLDDIEKHVMELPEGEQFDELRDTATQFVKDVRTSNVNEAMTSVETLLTDFQGHEAYLDCQQAADLLNQFVKKSQGGMGAGASACLKFDPTLNSGLGDTIDQLLADAGLSLGNSGKGNGAAGRGGYSMRSSNRNVGLYGNTPSLGQANAGRGFGPAGQTSTGKNAWGDSAADPATMSAPWQRSSSSASTGPIPPQYRRRVNLYFQRLADELEAAEK